MLFLLHPQFSFVLRSGCPLTFYPISLSLHLPPLPYTTSLPFLPLKFVSDVMFLIPLLYLITTFLRPIIWWKTSSTSEFSFVLFVLFFLNFPIKLPLVEESVTRMVLSH